VALSPDTKDYESTLKKYLGDFKVDDEFLQKLHGKKNKQLQKAKEAERLLDFLGKGLEKAVGIANFEKTKSFHKKVASRRLGLNLEEGKELEMLTINAQDGQKFLTNAVISKVDFVLQDNGPDKDLIDPSIQEAIQQDPLRNHAFQITLDFTDQNGNKVSSTYSEYQLKFLMQRARLTEKVENKTDLEEKLNLHTYGQSIEQGQVLEYSIGNKEFDSVKILKLDEVNQIIELDKAVAVHTIFGKAESNDPDTQVNKKTLSFAEFLKWMRHVEAEEQITLEELQEKLKLQPQIIKGKLAENVPYEVHDQPIEVVKGERIKIAAAGTEYEIVDVNPERIKLNTGHEFTPGQFYKFVKDYDVEKSLETPSKKDLDKAVDEIEGAIIEEGETEEPSNNKQSKSKKKLSALLPAIGTNLDVIGGIWNNVTFLSLKDIWTNMLVPIGDYIKRRLERAGKARAAKVGESLPLVGQEFTSMGNTAENEIVNKYQEDWASDSISQLRERLYNTSNRDVFKAAVNLLVEKGALRFDDVAFWETINRVGREELSSAQMSAYAINLDAKGKPLSEQENSKGLLPDACMKAIMDNIWGDGTYKGWENSNMSAYKSAVEGFSDDASKSSNRQRLAMDLHNMLISFLSGDENIEIGRYQSYLDYAIKQGLLSIEDKMFYLMAGVGLEIEKDGHMQSLISKDEFDRIAGSSYSANLPFLEWYVTFKPEGDDPLPLDYIREVVQTFGFNKSAVNTKDKSKRFKPEAVADFLQEKVLTHETAHVRTSKAMKNAGKFDHDDTFFIFPLLDFENTKTYALGRERGSSHYFSKNGFDNGFQGYTKYFQTLASVAKMSPEEQAKRKKLGYLSNQELAVKAIESFNLFESVLTGRHNFKGAGPKASPQDKKLWDGNSISQHISGINKYIEKVVRAYNMYNEEDIQTLLYAKHRDTEGIKAQETLINDFHEKFREVIKQDDGAKMLQILANHREFAGGEKPKTVAANKKAEVSQVLDS